MAVEESLDHRRKDDPVVLLAKQRAIDAYRRPFLEQLRNCSCRCHFPIACGCPKACPPCR